MSVDQVGELPDDRFGGLCDEWKKWAHGYLQHVATDDDLDTVVSFVA